MNMKKGVSLFFYVFVENHMIHFARKKCKLHMRWKWNDFRSTQLKIWTNKENKPKIRCNTQNKTNEAETDLPKRRNDPLKIEHIVWLCVKIEPLDYLWKEICITYITHCIIWNIQKKKEKIRSVTNVKQFEKQTTINWIYQNHCIQCQSDKNDSDGKHIVTHLKFYHKFEDCLICIYIVIQKYPSNR